MATLTQIKHALENEKPRSAWRRGVLLYAWDLFDYINEIAEQKRINEDFEIIISENDLLNGAPTWHDYSWGGCSLIYDEDIARTLCTPSKLKKTYNGERKPNKNEEWLDVQARALRQAAHLILSIQYKINHRSVK